MRLALLCVVGLIVAIPPVRAQDAPDDAQGVTEETQNTSPEDNFAVVARVRVRADTLMPEVMEIGVYCAIYSALYTDEADKGGALVGESYIYFYRSDVDFDSVLRAMDRPDIHSDYNVQFHKFEGDDINQTVEAIFQSAERGSLRPLHAWTHGDCTLFVVDERPPNQSYLPQDCTGEREAPPAFLGHCIWPGSEPKIVAEFTRPGLDGVSFGGAGDGGGE